MDLSELWQENKRFLLSVAGGIVLFAIAWNVVDGATWARARAARGRIAARRADLAKPMFRSDQRDRAREQNEALRAALDELAGEVEFHPRPEFMAADSASISSAYFATASDVRESLMTLAGRSGLRLPESLGLPPSVLDEAEIGRYLEGLDVVDRVVHLAMRAGVERIDAIRIRLDPAVLADRTLPPVERTRVELELSGAPQPLVRLLALTQEPLHGQPLLIDRVEMKSARTKRDEATLELVLLAVHLHGRSNEEPES